jgi:hypothetical protein
LLAPAGASVNRNFNDDVASILRSTSSAGAITSGPMPSPASTAMWSASLADMGVLSNYQRVRHGRACPGHLGLHFARKGREKKDVDARDKPGHDEPVPA